MPKGKSTKRGRKTKHEEVREADIKRMKKYGIPLALATAIASGGYKASPAIERELKKYFAKQPEKVSVIQKVKKLAEEEGREIPEFVKFGNVLAPAHRHPGNNIIAMNDPFSAIYTYDAPHTWGQIHDMATNLSGFPWYKGQEPTLAVKPAFGSKKKRKVKRKVTKKRKTANKKGWIQKAIKNPGSLTAYAKRVAPRKAFTKRGTLRVAWLREQAKTSKSMKRRRQAQLALRLKKMPKRELKRKVTKVKRKTTKRKRKLKSKRKTTKRKSKFGGKFNYTIQQYADNASTPNLNQMHKISGKAAYDYPIAGPSIGGTNLAWFDSKTNNAGMGTW